MQFKRASAVIMRRREAEPMDNTAIGCAEIRPRSAAAGTKAPAARMIVARNGDPFAGDGPNVVRNLSGSPKRIDAKYVYDAAGSLIFEKQVQQPEYYLGRAERALVRSHAGAVAEMAGACTVVELGSGSAEKTVPLLRAFRTRGLACAYQPIDIDAVALRRCMDSLAETLPGQPVAAVAGTYEDGLRMPVDGPARRLLVFLGGTIGNFEDSEGAALLQAVRTATRPGDLFLVGADLAKDPAIIDSAYNDAAGYGARSSLNMLAHLNWRYGGDFDLDAFAYVSRYDAARRRNVVHLRSRARQRVTLRGLDASFVFEPGELVFTEVMRKFTVAELEDALAVARFRPRRHWVDDTWGYGLFLFERGDD